MKTRNLYILLTLVFCISGCRANGEPVEQFSSGKVIDESKVFKICVEIEPPDKFTQTIDLSNLAHLEKVKFLSSGKIWLATGHFSREIYYSENTKQSWTKLRIGNVENFNTFDFADEENGWAIDTKGNVWKTTDGGQNWNKTSPFENLIKRQEFIGAENVEFSSSEHGWLREIFNLYQTTDGGKNWEMVNQLLEQPKKMFLLNNAGWVSFGKGSELRPLRLLRTADNGKSWTKSVLDARNSTEAIFFLNDKNGWLSTSGNELLTTNDSGKSWTKVNLSEKNFLTKSIFWLDSQNGWLAGATVDPDQPVSASVPALLSTSDGGKSWKKFDSKTVERFYNQVYFTDKNNGWVVSRDGLYKTNDGGQTLNPILKTEVNCR